MGHQGVGPGLPPFTDSFGGMLVSLHVCFPLREWKLYFYSSVGGRIELDDTSTVHLNAKKMLHSLTSFVTSSGSDCEVKQPSVRCCSFMCVGLYLPHS